MMYAHTIENNFVIDYVNHLICWK